jgi:hypothetical protein
MEQVATHQPHGDWSETLRELVAEAGRVKVALLETQKISSNNSMTREDSH